MKRILIVLVVLVVIVFLQTWRAAIIPIVAIPVALVGTFAVQLALGFSINSLSLFALVLAVGIVVDDAIVVVENVERNIRAGMTPREAAHRTMEEVSGALIDGPLALDNAIDPEAARIKKIESPVAGRANVLLVPDLEAGNMLAKSLTFMAGADAAGIVLGARVPIILTSRADSLITRLASCAVAVLVAKARREDLQRTVVV